MQFRKAGQDPPSGTGDIRWTGAAIRNTPSLKRRRTLLLDHIEALRESFRLAHAVRSFTLLAWVILPDHLHCVWRLPEGDEDNAARWRHIKSRFSRTIPTGERLSASRQDKAERGIWQLRYWKRVVRDEDHLHRCIDYVHINPQKHGHVEALAEWPHSSFHRYVEAGLLPTDWAEKTRSGLLCRHKNCI